MIGATHESDELVRARRARGGNVGESGRVRAGHWIITGTSQSSEAYGFMMRRDDPEFRRLVDDTLEQTMKGPEIHTMYDRWFVKPVPPKNISFDFPMSDSLKQRYAQPNDEALE